MKRCTINVILQSFFPCIKRVSLSVYMAMSGTCKAWFVGGGNFSLLSPRMDSSRFLDRHRTGELKKYMYNILNERSAMKESHDVSMTSCRHFQNCVFRVIKK